VFYFSLYISRSLSLYIFYLYQSSVFRDPTTGWGSMNFEDFAATFEVAAPYVPPQTSSSSGGLTTTEIVLIVLLVVGVVVVSVFLCAWLYGRRNQQAARSSYAVNSAPPARGAPVSIVNPQPRDPPYNPEVRDPYATYAAPRGSRY
jgi:hypothetical protein